MNPEYGKPLLAFDDVRQFVDDQKNVLALLQTDLARAHTRVNGKWFLRHLAPTETGKKPEQCRAEWLTYLIGRGGLGEVRTMWSRILADLAT